MVRRRRNPHDAGSFFFLHLPRDGFRCRMAFQDKSGWVWYPPVIRRGRGWLAFLYTVERDGICYIVQIEFNRCDRALLMVIGDSKKVVHCDLVSMQNEPKSWSIPLRDNFMQFVKKQVVAGGLKSLLQLHVDEGLQKKYSALYEYLTVTQYDENTPRETSTLSISVADDGYKFCLRDRDNARCLWVTSQTFFDGLRSLDAALRAEDAPWVKDRFSSQNGAAQKNGKKGR